MVCTKGKLLHQEMKWTIKNKREKFTHLKRLQTKTANELLLWHYISSTKKNNRQGRKKMISDNVIEVKGSYMLMCSTMLLYRL